MTDTTGYAEHTGQPRTDRATDGGGFSRGSASAVLLVGSVRTVIAFGELSNAWVTTRDAGCEAERFGRDVGDEVADVGAHTAHASGDGGDAR